MYPVWFKRGRKVSCKRAHLSLKYECGEGDGEVGGESDRRVDVRDARALLQVEQVARRVQQQLLAHLPLRVELRHQEELEQRRVVLPRMRRQRARLARRRRIELVGSCSCGGAGAGRRGGQRDGGQRRVRSRRGHELRLREALGPRERRTRPRVARAARIARRCREQIDLGLRVRLPQSTFLLWRGRGIRRGHRVGGGRKRVLAHGVGLKSGAS